MKHLAFHDNLTSLPNRILFDNRLAQALAHARQMNEMLAVMFLDLDRFKIINDALGHTIGASCCVRLRARLKSCAGEETPLPALRG